MAGQDTRCFGDKPLFALVLGDFGRTEGLVAGFAVFSRRLQPYRG